MPEIAASKARKWKRANYISPGDHQLQDLSDKENCVYPTNSDKNEAEEADWSMGVTHGQSHIVSPTEKVTEPGKFCRGNVLILEWSWSRKYD
jgi:hypothetical protein